MDEETLMLLSMKDSKSVADALSNKTAQKILSYIAENQEATESQLAEKLSIPLPTVHYNIQQLKKANLLKSKEFYWSKKGKKMRVFSLAKKYIIISPSKSKTTLRQLKGLLPVTFISIIGAGLIHLYQKSKVVMTDTGQEIARAVPETIEQEADSAMSKATGEMAGTLTNNITETIPQIIQEPNYALWFLIGSLTAILLVFIYNLIKKN